MDTNTTLKLLSKREQDIYRLLLKGLPNKRISNEIHISERTVKYHCSNIYTKLGVRNRYELMAKPIMHSM